MAQTRAACSVAALWKLSIGRVLCSSAIRVCRIRWRHSLHHQSRRPAYAWLLRPLNATIMLKRALKHRCLQLTLHCLKQYSVTLQTGEAFQPICVRCHSHNLASLTSLKHVHSEALLLL